ncbi:S41 family peptidase [Paenibacillus sp. 481]|uniref:S41 family peptidase n=1 Tax=Paenibacillus sp. 481 TaxID=2835869 RepID=UPI001E5E61DF|nr:S41 family peptidase [Paenibacillus sp. 481]UHA74388.1 PDZ domain-containing protein [Paenibacillus sp. 481]
MRNDRFFKKVVKMVCTGLLIWNITLPIPVFASEQQSKEQQEQQEQQQHLNMIMEWWNYLLDEQQRNFFKRATPEEAYRFVISEYHVSGISAQEVAGKSIEEINKRINDKYTRYFTKEQFKQFYVDAILNNKILALGISPYENKAGVYIKGLLAGGPAAKSSLQVNDYIVSINGKPLKTLNDDAMAEFVTGKEGQSAKLIVKRGEEQLHVTVPYTEVVHPTVTGSTIGESIGYIQVTGFGQDTDEQFKQALETGKQQKWKALVLDVRQNLGGVVDSAHQMASQMMEQGTLMYTKDRTGKLTPTEIKDGSKLDMPIVMLVDEYSASASEILGGALQDNKTATLVGVKTFGKGVMQSYVAFPKADGMSVTILEYLTPNKHKVNEVGLTPDIVEQDWLAQIIRGLRVVGEQRFDMVQDAQSLTLNGKRFGDAERLKWIVEANGVYVNAHTLGALVGAEVTWNSDKSQLVFTTDNRRYVFPHENGAVKTQGELQYLKVNELDKYFPQLEWKLEGEQLRLSFKAS